jgi:hypothetical protein
MRKALYIVVGCLIVGCLTLTHLSCSSSSDDDDGGTTTPADVQQTLDETSVRDALTFIEDNVPACTMEDGADAQETTTVRSTLGLVGGISDNIVLHRTAQLSPTRDIDETIPGTCDPNPGELVMTLDEDESTGTISGSLVFDSFCQTVDEETLLVNGTVDISGTFNTSTGELESLSISTGIGGLSVQTDTDMISAGLNSLSVSVSGPTTTITMNTLSVSANVDGETSDVTVNNLAATMTEYADSMELDASVQYVDDDGYVDITVVDLMVNDQDQTVLGGALKVTGANGTDIKITYQSASDGFLVEADTNGDGTYDYQPGTMDCSELDIDELLGNFPF